MPITGDAGNDPIRTHAPAAVHTPLPPRCPLDMQGEFLEHEDGVCMSLRVPVLPRYRDPMGNMQRGFIVAAHAAQIAQPCVVTSNATDASVG